MPYSALLELGYLLEVDSGNRFKSGFGGGGVGVHGGSLRFYEDTELRGVTFPSGRKVRSSALFAFDGHGDSLGAFAVAATPVP